LKIAERREMKRAEEDIWGYGRCRIEREVN
jgi:hypothetical protein